MSIPQGRENSLSSTVSERLSPADVFRRTSMPTQETRLCEEALRKLPPGRENIMAYIKADDLHEKMFLGLTNAYSRRPRAVTVALELNEWSRNWEAASKR
jgi:hypothetical protein